MTTQSIPQVHRWRAFAVLAVSYFMTIIDLAIVNTALPTIGRALHFSESNLQWVVTAYAITFGGFLLLGGRAADPGETYGTQFPRAPAAWLPRTPITAAQDTEKEEPSTAGPADLGGTIKVAQTEISPLRFGRSHGRLESAHSA